ncbi:MAG TPA: hypothetical protein VFS42_05775, partial [Burkholderiaceae bacterium]|nr:hypothetical protein [Burkholderiaceae bacterium]
MDNLATPPTAAAILERARECEMAPLSGTGQRLAGLMSNESEGVQRLAEVVLSDAALTQRTLRAVNTVAAGG